MTSAFFKSSGKKDSEKHSFILSWNVLGIISTFSLIILVGILSFWMVFEESRVLIRDSMLCFATPLNEKLDLLGYVSLLQWYLGAVWIFQCLFPKGSRYVRH